MKISTSLSVDSIQNHIKNPLFHTNWQNDPNFFYRDAKYPRITKTDKKEKVDKQRDTTVSISTFTVKLQEAEQGLGGSSQLGENSIMVRTHLSAGFTSRTSLAFSRQLRKKMLSLDAWIYYSWVWGMLLLRSSGCPETHPVDHTGLELMKLHLPPEFRD